MNFNSQICTTREQSERLLALGLKKETADMCWNKLTLHGTPVTYPSQDVWTNHSIISDSHFPAWSLHRLIEIVQLPQSWECISGNWYEEVIATIQSKIHIGELNKEYLEE